VVSAPSNPTWAAYLRTIEAAAPSFGVRLIPAGVRDAAEITQRIATFARDPNGALVVLPSPVTIRCPLLDEQRKTYARCELFRF
jgi:hypothetical protein